MEHGRTLSLSPPRRLVGDLLHFAKQIPTVPVQRVFDVARVRELRQRTNPRISWSMIFTKAFAITAREMPVFRRAYLTFPYERLYEHPFSSASVAFERDFQGEPAVFFGLIERPEEKSLSELELISLSHREKPVEEAFAFTYRFSRLPKWVRRFGLWYLLNVRGDRKAVYLGTFGISVYSGLGAESLHPLSPLTATLNYGVIAPDGKVTVRIVYDHRVMDGATTARALLRMEEIMTGPIADELQELGAA